MDSTFRVTTPQHGSWEILIEEALKITATTAIQVPIQAMIQYGLQSIFPLKWLGSKAKGDFGSKDNDALMRALEIIEKNDEYNHKHIETLHTLLAEAKSNANDNNLDRLSERIGALEDSASRAEYLKAYPQLREVDSDARVELIQKTRPQVREIGYPLKKSAEKLDIGVSEERADYKNTLHLSDVESLDDSKVLDEVVVVVGSLKKFDKETGWGELRQHNTGKILRFVVKRSEKRRKLSDILDAMSGDIVVISGNPVVDANNAVKYYIFIEFIGDHDDG
ncbi:hypothetical protein GCM10017621_33200 [Maricaulis virginensis]|uniref:Uncharacterized protein n=1 Tax=Maricaulis virginensis TaxID=144022 RepID=A0A9W6IQH2_9PROT|nr:hypothetical protein GCM10017621_33200 [Maricaulis virginensis]